MTRPLPQLTTQFIWPFFRNWLLTLSIFVLSLCAISAPSAYAADGAEITKASIETSDEGYRLSAAYSFELNSGLVDAINRGIPLYFKTEVELTRPRWYWFDEQAIDASQTVRISYNVLTRRYHASIISKQNANSPNLQQSFSSLDDALSLVRRPNRWVIAEKDALKAGETYKVSVRMGLDLSQLPKPFQVNSFNNSDWRLSSDWKNFNYKVE